MVKIKIIFALILGIPFFLFGQWEEKNILTNSTLTSVNFITDDIGFVTGGNVIYNTENGGDDWAISYTANDLVVYEDIFVIDSNRIIAVGIDLNSNQSVITKTENGGADWNDVPTSSTSLLKSVSFVSPNVGFCSGGGGVILKTTDSGNSWQELSSGTSTNLQSIFFVNERVGIAVGGNLASAVILKTLDGGVNWKLINSPSNNNLQSVYFSNQDTGYVVGWNGEIMRTNNCGDDWAIQNSVAMTGNLEVVFTDDNTGYIVGGAMNESLIQKTSNGGDLWEDISPQISEGLVCIQFPSFNIGYAVGSNGTVVKTDTGGLMTSTSEFGISNEFKTFPNPTNESLNIESNNRHQIEKVRIYDTNGRLIKEIATNSINPKINLSKLVSNIYYLTIHSDNKTEILKIVKK